MSQFKIAGHPVGAGCSCFIIAEAGVNHNGDLAMAHRLIDVAADAGVDAIKFQTFRTELVVSEAAPKAAYQESNTGEGGTQADMIRKLELPFEDFLALKIHAEERGLVFMSTPFDAASADYLAGIGMAAFKVPSGEITNHPLLRRIASHRLPVILSTGMSWLGEVEQAVSILRAAGVEDIAILHCTSNYPTDPAEVNLRAMDTLATVFKVPVGYSDHTLGIEIPLAAVARGATIIEKHITLDCSLPGPDHLASLDPAGLVALVAGIRKVEVALGDGVKRPQPGEENVRSVARRSLFLALPVQKGSVLREDDLIALRPAGGLRPDQMELVVGRHAARDLPAGAQLAWPDLT